MSAFLAAEYNYLQFDNQMLTLEMIVWSMFVGIVLGALASLYNKRVLGAFVRALLKGGADTPDSALTLGSLGFTKNIFVAHALKNGGSLRKIVRCAEEPGIIPRESIHPVKRFFSFATIEFQEKLDVQAAKFYIPEELSYRAEIRYEKRGTDILAFLMTVLVFLVVAYLSIIIIPELLGMVDSVITNIMSSEETLWVAESIFTGVL